MPSSAREVAHDARQLLPRIADRLHARLHHAFLQLGGDIREPLQRHFEIGILVAADDLKELVAGEHELGNRGHEVIERIDVDADRMACEPVAALIVGPLGRGPFGRRLVSACARRPRLRRLLGGPLGGMTSLRRRRAGRGVAL